MAWNLDQVLQQLKMARSELKEIQCQSWETHDEGLHQHLQEGGAKYMDSQILMQLRRQPRRLKPSFGVRANKLPTKELNRCSNPLPMVAPSRDWIFQKLKMAEWYKALMANLLKRCS
jgi:hypothetical protein